MQRRRWCYGCLAAALTAVLLAEAGGCAELFATVAYLTVGTDEAADFPGLKGKKVVVVCRPLAELQYRDAVAAKRGRHPGVPAAEKARSPRSRSSSSRRWPSGPTKTTGTSIPRSARPWGPTWSWAST